LKDIFDLQEYPKLRSSDFTKLVFCLFIQLNQKYSARRWASDGWCDTNENVERKTWKATVGTEGVGGCAIRKRYKIML